MPSSTTRTLYALGTLVLRTLPAARAEARRWAQRVEAIPSAALRERARHALQTEDVNVISAAALALLAPCRHRQRMVELLMAWRVICSYVDDLGEQPSQDPLANGLQLHGALVDAVSPSHDAAGGYYRFHGDDADGGYLEALVRVCRLRMSELAVRPDLERVARLGAQRCAQAQSHMHSAAQTGSTRALRQWAISQCIVGDWHWWEVVAASIADLPIMAAMAASDVTPGEAYHAHWPAAALASLLDSVVDADSDACTGDYSLIANYASDEAARKRLAAVATRAHNATRALPAGHLHSAIVAGVIAHYATVPGSRTPRGEAMIGLAREQLRPTITPIVATIRIHRAVRRPPESDR